ncbi:MAG TPA: HAMP domain-containing sensor histidine kinase [Hyphomicrobiales bacterium]|nr:HAMP domain-containing sensor histidine kinase [Hyphomicrobiales bacterium]
MLSFKPRSILQLTITGFLTVASLLILALVATSRQLDVLGEQSQRVINQSVAAIREGRTLMEQGFAMERNVRQYQVLKDEQILRVYEERRSAFAAAALQLQQQGLDAELGEQVRRLLEHEAHIYEVVQAPELRGEATALLPTLTRVTQAIASGIDRWTEAQLAEIRQETRNTRRLLSLQAVVLTVAALVMAAIFTALITRPLAQINRAINRLGDGKSAAPVRISGPTDLVRLGERLEWLRERLRTLERQRSAFLRHVSHELKTPLAAIQESAALLSEEVVGGVNARQQDILRIQHNNCQRLSTLINELLRHHEDSFAVIDMPPQPVRLDQLVDAVLANQELALRARKLQLDRHLSPLVAAGNPEQLRVIIDNLLSNAIRHSPEGGTISVSVQRDGEALLCEVADEGPGVAPEDAGQVFEAFYRGTTLADSPYLGSGLGLAIAEEYAKANQGTLSLLPHAGKGARFCLSLPLFLELS